MLHSNEDIFINNLQVFYDMLNNDLGKLGFYQILQKPNKEIQLLSISKTCCEQIGYTKKEVEANPNIITDIITEPYKALYLENRNNCFLKPGSTELEIKCELLEGIVKWFQLYAESKLLADQSVVFNVIQTDITVNKSNKEKLLKYNRELSLRNLISDLIAKQTNLQDLFNSVCSCLVNEGGYALVVITPKPEPENPDQRLHPIAAFGRTDYINEIVIDFSDPVQRMGPACSALIENKTIILNDFHVANRTSTWWKAAEKYNIAASIVIPLSFANDKMAIITIYSDRVEAYDAHEVEILEKIADSVSIASKSIQHKIEKDKAAYDLRERIKELQIMYHSNKILQNEQLKFEDKVKQIVEILPKGWQFVDDCVAKIVVNNQSYYSLNYQTPQFKQSASIVSIGKQMGYVELGYYLNHPLANEGPFLIEERILLDALAKAIGESYDKHEAQAALIQTKANLLTIFKSTEIGYILLDKNFSILSFNDALQNGYGNHLGIHFKKGANFISLLPADRKPEKEEKFFNVITQKKPVEYEVMFKGVGHNFFYYFSIHPVITKNNVMGLVFSIQDITNRKLAELEQRKISHDLIKRNRDLEQFSYIVSHNIRAPLSNILGLKEALKLTMTEEEKQFVVEGIGKSAEILDQVVKDVNHILQLNRSITENKTHFYFADVLSEVQAGLQNILVDKNASITSDFALAPDIYSIKTYFISIFHTLVLNGIKYSRPNVPPMLKIWSQYDDQKLVIHFIDNGLGVDLEKYGEHFFGLYKRFHPQIQGKGLGLFLLKSQVQFLDGEITVNSKPDVGTEFIIYLPLT